MSVAKVRTSISAVDSSVDSEGDEHRLGGRLLDR